jgi:hypothetical protein
LVGCWNHGILDAVTLSFIRRTTLFPAAIALLCLPVRLTAQTNFAVLANDGAWTWFNDPRALFDHGRLFFGYDRAADGKTVLSAFDLSTGTTTNLWTSEFTQLDDHNMPGLLPKEDGTMLAVYSRHGADQYFAWRVCNDTNTASAASWGAEQLIANTGASMTYANPFQLSAEGGRIYNFCRNLNYNPTVFVSTDGAASWSTPQLFIQTGAGGTIRPYVKYDSDYTQRIDFLYTDGHPRDITNSLYHLYYQAGSFRKTDGTFVKNYSDLPILHDSGERGSVIYQYSDADTSDLNDHIPTGRAWSWEIVHATNGNPICVFTVQRDNVTGPSDGIDDRIYYYYARWTGSNWQKRFIAQAGRPLYVAEDDYAGGICVDPQDPNTIYISSNAEQPFNLTDTTNVTLRANARYELWRGITTNGGLSFSWTQITTNSTVDNLRPYIPRRRGGEPCVIWFRGTYSAYTAYSASIVGLFTTAVPASAPPALITYVDATSGSSGNTVIASGGGTFNPSSNASGTDGLWRARALGNSATIFEAGGDTSSAGSAVNGNNEDVARLATSISGLIPGFRYNAYAYFWSAGGAQDWRIRAGLTNVAGDLALFSNSTEPTAVASDFTVAPLITEADRLLQQASLGIATADSTGRITIYLDDDPSARAGIANGWNYRTWYDGVGYSLITSLTPTNLTFTASTGTVTVSWPQSHLGWILQSLTNQLSSATSSDWSDVTNSASNTEIVVTLTPTNPATFYRLRRPNP